MAVGICLSKPELDLTGAPAPISAISLPPETIDADTYQDGGSICVRIIDADGRNHLFALPVSSSGSHPYPKVYIGAEHISRPGAVEVGDSPRVRAWLLKIMKAYPAKLDEWGVDVYFTLLNRPPTLREQARMKASELLRERE